VNRARPIIRCPFERARLRDFLSRQLHALQCRNTTEVRDVADARSRQDQLLAMWRPLVGDATVRSLDALITSKPA